jgi:HEAT repeat protein
MVDGGWWKDAKRFGSIVRSPFFSIHHPPSTIHHPLLPEGRAMHLRCLVLTSLGLLLAGLGRAAAADPDTAAADEQALLDAKVPADGPGLVEFFRKRTPPELDRARALALIRKLGDEEYAVREQASADLRGLGPAVKGLLREALKDPDPEISFRALQCLIAVERVGKPEFLGAAVRTLVRQKPPGAAEALLAFLPHVEDGEVLDQASQALAEVGVKGGKIDPALTQALTDKWAVSRAAAGEALARAGGADGRAAARRLLQDADAAVRQRVALALLELKDKEAVPALIDLLAEAPRERAWRVEEVLARVAGDQAPAAEAGDDEASRRTCRDAWVAWWKEHGAGLDLARLDLTTRPLGYTLIAELPADRKSGRVYELDAAGKVRWELEVGRIVVDAQTVGADHVLVADYTSRTVTERTVKNDVLWQYAPRGLLLGARRLPNGDTFVVCRNQIVQVDKDGKEVRSLPRDNDVAAAARFRDGRVAVLTTGGALLLLDETGKELKSFPLNAPVLAVGTNIDLAPGGHVLVPLFSANKVVEVDGDGKVVCEASVRQPNSVQRLPNGHWLVASRATQTVTEVDRAGKELRTFQTDGAPYRAARR